MDWEQIISVLFLRDYNTRLVVFSTLLLGVTCGIMGGFLLLRKRSLMGDTLSHATLPGIVGLFLAGVFLGNDGKSFMLLLVGAAVTGLLGCWLVLFIREHTRLKDDAAMGIVLSVFFGAGVALLGMAQTLPEGSAAGLESFIYGKTASMVATDFQILVVVSLLVLGISILLFKEFKLLCFDETFARSLGFSTRWLDVLMLGLVTAVTVAGLQAVGLILIIAFLITPAAAARFWTEKLERMLILSSILGGLSGWIGASLSALLPRMPAGAVIVLVAAGFFVFSMLFGTARGVLLRYRQHRELRFLVSRQHLLRALFEILEGQQSGVDELEVTPVPYEEVRITRTWTDRALNKTLAHAFRDGLVKTRPTDDTILLSSRGLEEAAKVTRNHRLWELYLIEFADIATSRVDRGADRVEHVLGEELVQALEAKLQTYRWDEQVLVPASPHPIAGGVAPSTEATP